MPCAAHDGDHGIPGRHGADRRCACAPHALPRAATTARRRARRSSPRRWPRTPAPRHRGARQRPPTSARRRVPRRPRRALRSGRVDRRRATSCSRSPDKRPGHRHVDRHGRHSPGVRPARRLPLRAEVGEWPEGGPGHVIREIAEQRHGRSQTLVGDPLQHRCAVGRQLDEHDVGLDLLEGAEHGPSRARAHGAGCREDAAADQPSSRQAA